MVYLYLILGLLFASIEGVREAFYYYVQKDVKRNIHWIYYLQRTLFTILFYSLTNFFILACFVLSFSFMHDGFYYVTRNKLDPSVYARKFIDSSTTSTAIMEFNFTERTIFLVLGIVFLILNLIYR